MADDDLLLYVDPANVTAIAAFREFAQREGYTQLAQRDLLELRATKIEVLPEPAVLKPGDFGIDVSHWQGDHIDWPKVLAAGYKFVIIKATTGARKSSQRQDRRFCPNYEGAQAAGLLTGAYHWLVPHEDPVEQADFFCDALAGLKIFKVALDLEQISPVVPHPRDVVLWLQRVETRLGMVPYVYTSAGVIQAMRVAWGEFALAEWPLWVASYRESEAELALPHAYPPNAQPTMPYGWDWAEIWQYRVAPEGYVDGIPTKIDLNIYRGPRPAPMSETFPGPLNQDAINQFYRAAGQQHYIDWLQRAGIYHKVIAARKAAYAGPAVEAMTGLTPSERLAVIAQVKASSGGIQNAGAG